MGVCWPVLKEGDSLGVIDTKVQIRVRMVKFTTFVMNYFLKRKLIYIQQCVLFILLQMRSRGSNHIDGLLFF